MKEMMKAALSESDGTPSSSRIGMWAMIAISGLLKILGAVIVIDSYFFYHEIPNSDTILVVLFGASVGSDVSSAMLYFSNQYGNRLSETLPEPPPNDTAFAE